VRPRPAEAHGRAGVLLRCRGAEFGRPFLLDFYADRSAEARERQARQNRLEAALRALGIQHAWLDAGLDPIPALGRLLAGRGRRRAGAAQARRGP
jgi:hypothetical protein